MDLAAHVEHFRARVLQDAIETATAAHWNRRAEQFAAVGNARCDEIALACRNHAAFLAAHPIAGIEPEVVEALREGGVTSYCYVVEVDDRTVLVRGYQVSNLLARAGLRGMWSGVGRGIVLDRRRLPDVRAVLEHAGARYREMRAGGGVSDGIHFERVRGRQTSTTARLLARDSDVEPPCASASCLPRSAGPTSSAMPSSTPGGLCQHPA